MCTTLLPFQCNRLDGGLTKIAEAQIQLDELNKKLAVQKVAVTEKTAACEVMLETIAEGSKTATEKKELAVAKGTEIEEQSKIIVVEKVRLEFSHYLRGIFANLPSLRKKVLQLSVFLYQFIYR